MSNYDGNGNLLVVDKAAPALGVNDLAGDVPTSQQPVTWSITTSVSNPGGTLTKAAVAGQRHYVLGFSVSTGGTAGGDFFFADGGVGKVQHYNYNSPYFQSFGGGGYRCGVNAAATLTIENMASGAAYLTLWGYTA